MKSCPTCNRTFDDTFTFCLADGSLLSPPFDPQATLRVPAPRDTEPPPTEVMGADALPRTQRAVGVKDVPPTIASPAESTLKFNANLLGQRQAAPYSAQPRKKNVLIWLIPIIAIAAIASLIYALSGRENAGNTSASNKVRSESTPSEAAATPYPAPSVSTATPTPTATPTMNRTDDSQRTTQQSSNVSSSSASTDDEARAIETVRAILRRNAGGCKINRVLSVSAQRTAFGWKVTATVVMSASGSPLTETASWGVSDRNGAVAASQLSAEIEHGCN
ncbi:MAG TPA: hypothetical protein VKB86_13270 [Pyrinomonadaceae bacterium]|nr:hypothetical protein [Pyrinomonadaceae bacterium]